MWSRIGSPARGARSAIRRVTHAQGAGRTGLGDLIELQAVNSAGDALIAVSLAGTLFFGLDVNQARTQVALYLLITMAPFALVAPLIGPALDHLRAARRFAIAGTMAFRAVLCWAMAGAVSGDDDPVTLLPAAFGALVLSKAFGISRSALMPRVLPENLSLVTVNARTSFVGLASAAVVMPSAAGLSAVIGGSGPAWLLRIGTVVFIVGAILGTRLPRHADTPEDEHGLATPGHRGFARWRHSLRVGPVVGEAMRANAALRGFSGFLILYLAFLLREHQFSPVSGNVALGLLAAAAGIGGLAGTGTGALVKARAPQLFLFATLAFVSVVAVLCAAFFGIWAALAVAGVGAFGQSMGKLSMDATVQREIGEDVRSSTFAVSEALHQLAWVTGGLLGLIMSIVAAENGLGLVYAAAALALAFTGLLLDRMRRRVSAESADIEPSGHSDQSAAPGTA